MRILVIGGSGFIGRFLVPELARAGHEAVVLHRGASGWAPPPGVREIRGDRRNLGEAAPAIREFRPDVVIDVILSSGTQARALMEVSRGVAKRVVALSSMDVYRACGVLHGLEPGPLEPLPLREDSPLRTRLQTYPEAQVKMLQGIFGWLDDEYDKVPVEHAIMGDVAQPLPASATTSADESPAGTVLRLPMIYGPGDPLHRFVPMLKRMLDGRPAIVMPESLASWRSPRGYVENVVAAIALAATSERAASRIYNVGEAESFTELEWARLIADVVGWRGELVVVADERAPPSLRMPGNFAQHWVVDTSRIREELGFREPVARDEAIRCTVEWERAHPPAHIPPGRFDYDAEDALLAALGR